MPSHSPRIICSHGYLKMCMYTSPPKIKVSTQFKIVSESCLIEDYKRRHLPKRALAPISQAKSPSTLPTPNQDSEETQNIILAVGVQCYMDSLRGRK